jgi:hypothetical protein
MMPNYLIPLFTLIGIFTFLIGISLLISYMLPDRFVEWYAGKRDNAVDLGVSLLSLAFGSIIFDLIRRSVMVDGWVHISAVEFNEGIYELIVLGLFIPIIVIHLSMQFAILRRTK